MSIIVKSPVVAVQNSRVSYSLSVANWGSGSHG